MNPNNMQPGQVNNGQPVQAAQTPNVAPQGAVSPNPVKTAPKKNSKTLIFGGIGLVAVVAIAVAVVFILKNKSDAPAINFEEDNKIGMNTIRAAEVDPTNYELKEQDEDETAEKADQYLDSIEMGVDAFLDYYKKKIDAQLAKNNTDEALKLLWREQDQLQHRGFNELSQKILLEMDTSKLVNFQKIYLYRAIVTASALVGDQDTLNKYSAMVDELDPPENYIYPSDPDAIEPEEDDDYEESINTESNDEI